MLDKNEENVDKSIETSEETINKVEEVVAEKIEATEVVENEVENTVEEVEVVKNDVSETTIKEEDKKEVEMPDFDAMNLESLVEELGKLVKNEPVQKIKKQTDAIKNAFNAKFGELLSEKKEAFLAEGGNVIDFQFSSPVKTEFNKLLSEYKTKRNAHYGEIEKQYAANLEKREETIEALKKLIEEADTNTMYKQFRELQDTWKGIGPVQKTKYNDTWKIYHHHVERFYDLLHLSNDFRDLDFKHNLEAKLNIIEKAEALAAHKDVNYAFKELQELHKVWKEDLGPVARDMREPVWEKFSEATKKIHDKRHDYLRELKAKSQDIINEKLEIINQINAFDTSKNKNHKDWQNSIKELEVLRQKYFDAGKLPYAKSEAIWKQFKNATKKFNQSKNVFYKGEKSEQQENLNKKIALIELAESIQDSEDWDTATNSMKKVQADWKKIGHVPRKFSDDIWKRFKAACNHYFDRLHAQKNAVSEEQQAIADKKKQFLDTLDLKGITDLEGIKELMNTWSDMGRLPKNARNLETQFNKELEQVMDSLSIDKQEISMMKFKSTIGAYLEDNNVRKLDSEQFFIRKKIDETVREIQQLETNISFISNVTEDNPLVKNVRNQINGFKDNLEVWKTKLSYLKTLEY